MKKLLRLWIALFGISAVGVAQESGKCSIAMRSKEKPSIYISIEKPAESVSRKTRLAVTEDANEKNAQNKPDKIGVVQSYFFLRISNNTNWAIQLQTESLYISSKYVAPFSLCDGRNPLGLREGVEISALYKVRSTNSRNASLIAPSSDVRSSVWLPSGQSALFRVPQESLAKDSAVSLFISYEWEGNGNEPQHEVYFYWYQLPEEFQRSILKIN